MAFLNSHILSWKWFLCILSKHLAAKRILVSPSSSELKEIGIAELTHCSGHSEKREHQSRWPDRSEVAAVTKLGGDLWDFF